MNFQQLFSKFKLYAGLIVLTINFAQAQNLTQQCEQYRGAFDVGSGSIKVLVAKVDICKHQILEEISNKSEKLKLEIVENNFTESTIGNAVKTVQGLKISALADLEKYANKKALLTPPSVIWSSVATAAYRNYVDPITRKFLKKAPNNASNFVTRMNTENDIKLKVISQEEEAFLSYDAAFATEEKSKKPHNIVLWDMGAGSSQWLIFQRKNNLVDGKKIDFKIPFFTDLASNKAKDIILKSNQLTEVSPINNQQIKESIKFIKNDESFKNIVRKQELKKSLRNLKVTNPQVKVVGIGGVLSASVIDQVRSFRKSINDKNTASSFTIKEVEHTINMQKSKSIKDLGKYGETQVSNLIYVYTMMKTLHLSEVTTKNVNLAQGVVVQSASNTSDVNVID